MTEAGRTVARTLAYPERVNLFRTVIKKITFISHNRRLPVLEN